MPYKSVNEAVKKHPNLSEYSDKAQSGWVKSFNNAIEEKDDESYAFAVAYSVANKIDGKKRRGSMSTKRRRLSGNKKEYQKFFQKKLDEYGVDSPEDMNDKTKKKFFEEIDDGWTSDDEKRAKVAKSLVRLAKELLK
jgi:superoxide dismutase